MRCHLPSMRNGCNEEDRPHHPLVCLQDACNAHSLLVAENGMAVLENMLAVSYTIKHVFIIWLSNFAPSHLRREKWKRMFTQTYGHSNTIHGLPWRLSGKESTRSAEVSSPCELGRSPGEGNGYPLQYSCLENPRDWGVWQATVHGVTKDLDTTEQLNNNYYV